MPAKHAGRSGRPWRRTRKQILAASDICHICGHDGATEVDHLLARSMGGDSRGKHNLAPAHGSSRPCPTCGKCCNQVRYWAEYRAAKEAPTSTNTSRTW